MRRLKALLPMILFCAVLAGISLIGMTLTACSSLENMCISEGRILQTAHGGYLFIDENHSPISMSDGSKKGTLFEGLTDGDLVRLRHSLVAETYPGQATGYSLKKLEDGQLSDLPRELLENLTEMGWINYTSDELDQIYNVSTISKDPLANTQEDVPTLTILFHQDQVTAMNGTSSWHYPSGEYLVNVERDSLHPLQCEALPCLPSFASTAADFASSPDSQIATLLFDTDPDKVTVECWPYEVWEQGGPQWHSTPDFWDLVENKKEPIEVSSSAKNGETFFQIRLKEEPAVYQILALWKDSTRGGTVYYSFCTSLSGGQESYYNK